MKRVGIAGLLFVAVVEACAVAAPDRRIVLWAAGGATALVLSAARCRLTGTDTAPIDSARDDAAESLRRWVSRTESRLRWAEGTRADWDRHLRPRLASEFIAAAGHRQASDPAALRASGQVVFGDALWPWVDPGNVTHRSGREPGPGRAALEEILRRMEQV